MRNNASVRILGLAVIAGAVLVGMRLRVGPRDTDGLSTSTATLPVADQAAGEQAISFNRDIRPILSDKCFACHGPDAAVAKDAGGFRLDTRGGATAPAEASGKVPIVPGDADASEAIRRITSTKPNLVMPPPKAKMSVSPEERQLLRRWINEGAEYEGHWAYQPPNKPAAPEVNEVSERWIRNDIDRFIAARLEQAGLSPSEDADKTTLIRRASLDLTGLPPTPEEIDAFLADESADAYEKLIDRLLASPHFGERMALPWLDAARYADTIGYQLDHYRSAWPYRDYVIKSFNENKPYNVFLVEQLAGDLLPDATEEQRLATAFCRMHMMNHEGGSIDEEFRVTAVADRIETIATVFMAQTYNCAMCHDHKYDPTTQQDYYNLFKYFHSINERGVWTNKPERAIAYGDRLYTGTTEQKTAMADAKKHLEEATRRFKTAAKEPKDKKAELKKAVEKARRSLVAAETQAVPVSIMKELDKPKPMYVLARGAYDKPIKDKPAKLELPSFIDLPMPDSVPNNRLGFAKWLVQPGHPLTARVHVNRLWQMVFGTGIVATVEDFGSQAAWPSHPELLDYLAVAFIESGWDQKALLKQIVTSATYRQQAKRNLQAHQTDAGNRLLSYFPRQRLAGELIRDHALAASGLLNKAIGGPSVKPYQPAGLWREVSMGPRSNTNVFKRDDGDKLYRRSLYTFIKRKSPPPQLATFGTPNREACVVTRGTTNTPLQALALWNDEQFLEAARVLAQHTLQEVANDDDRLTLMARRCLGEAPNADEMKVLKDALAHFRQRYAQAPEDAKALLEQGEHPLPEQYNAAELASWMMIGSTILSLDETIVRD
ncbi:MAG: PSD1 and planctomycete cytochrome C domain-containing protein [Phycisphaeraceae bacterium]|nr:PSD1 and planctomycete cytochrome C domain-containing protein [Phycisphaeraceae bacterium]